MKDEGGTGGIPSHCFSYHGTGDQDDCIRSTKLAIGPSIADGFYYDVDRETPLTAEDLEKIEAEMKKIVKEGLADLERFTMTQRRGNRSSCKEKEEPYKVELIEDLPEDAEISFYQPG